MNISQAPDCCPRLSLAPCSRLLNHVAAHHLQSSSMDHQPSLNVVYCTEVSTFSLTRTDSLFSTRQVLKEFFTSSCTEISTFSLT